MVPIRVGATEWPPTRRSVDLLVLRSFCARLASVNVRISSSCRCPTSAAVTVSAFCSNSRNASSVPPPVRRGRPRRTGGGTEDAFRELLQNALTVTAALVGQRQDEEMRTLTEASLAQNERRTRRSTDLRVGGHSVAPTLIGTIYGMNFDTMPELHRPLGYPMAVFLMIAMGVVLYLVVNADTGSDVPRRRTPSHGFGLGFGLPATAPHPPFSADAQVVGDADHDDAG